MNSTSREEVGDQLAYAMKLIIIPLLSRSFELGQHEIVADATVDSMVKDMFDPVEEVQGEVAPGAIGVLEWFYYHCSSYYYCCYHYYCCKVLLLVLLSSVSQGVLECSQMALNSKHNLAAVKQNLVQSNNPASSFTIIVVYNQHIVTLYSFLCLHIQASTQMPSMWSCFKWQRC